MVKIKVILYLKPPVNQKQIKIFLVHTGYYRKFFRHYFDITFPIDKNMRKNSPFIWSNECNESLQLLKEKLIEALILKILDWSKKFHVHVDASNIAIGVVLAQPDEELIDHPNAYGSRKLNKVERNHSTTEREALAMILCCKNFETIYWKTLSYFTLITKH